MEVSRDIVNMWFRSLNLPAIDSHLLHLDEGTADQLHFSYSMCTLLLTSNKHAWNLEDLSIGYYVWRSQGKGVGKRGESIDIIKQKVTCR